MRRLGLRLCVDVVEPVVVSVPRSSAAVGVASGSESVCGGARGGCGGFPCGCGGVGW